MSENVKNPKILFGKRIQQIRKQRMMTQNDLAEKSGLDRSYISGCESGKRNVSLMNIYILADALEVKPSFLFEEDEESYE